ncbi:hypothetical protein EA58_13730 [Photobacterium galatheae]|uniref:Uncharacterized protein n=2 Tax=Photobacterium galatheae TaxID=1654360 RepID=A0A066RNY5_9GAMM|nr:hypothetical protein EA58_13730 [Photobacterium galatheae]
MRESDSALFAKLLTDCSFFSEISRFANITSDDNQAKNYLKEYFSEYKACNNEKDIYKNRMPLNIPLVNSVHIQLSKAMSMNKK